MNKTERKPNRVLRLLLIHLGAAALLAVWLWLTGCPIYRLTGIPCPGCGMTRALFRLLFLDFAGAWYYHPLVFVIPPAILYLVHRKAWRLPGGRKAATVVAVVCAVALVAVYTVRGLTPDTFVSNTIHTSVFAR